MRNVLADGVFDLLHANHAAFLEQARGFGDRLVVAVLSDRRVREYKRWPVLREQERLAVVRALRCVDEAFVLDDPLTGATMERLIRVHGISAVVYGGTGFSDYYGPAEAAGIMRRLPYRGGINSSQIIERIVDRRLNGDL